MTCEDFTDDLALLVNPAVQVESLMHRLHMNEDKIDVM